MSVDSRFIIEVGKKNMNTISKISPDSILGMRFAAGEITVDHLVKYLSNQLSNEQSISAICSYIDTQGLVDRFVEEASAYVDAQHSVTEPATNANSADGENDFLAELEALDETWLLPSDQTPAVSVIQGLLSRGSKKKSARIFVEGFLTTSDRLDAISQHIVDEHLISIFDDAEAIYPYQHDTSLSFLLTTGLDRREATLISMRFIEDKCPASVLGVLCAQIEADGDAPLVHRTLKWYERDGLSDDLVSFLERRTLMSPEEYYTEFDMDCCESPPFESPPSDSTLSTNPGGLSVFESLKTMGEVGLLTKHAQHGVAVSVINHGWRDRLRVVLCRYIDGVDQREEFVEFTGRHIECDAQFDALMNDT
jgi:hypothetical protein